MSAVAVTAALVRLPFVYSRPFWEDEVASARILVQPTMLAMLRRVAQTESTPPLWYAIAWLVHQLGVPLQSERLLSVAFGAALAAAVVGLTHRFVALQLAVVAGLMTAFGTEFVLHGAELRAYELFALLSVVLGASVLGLLDHSRAAGTSQWEQPSRPVASLTTSSRSRWRPCSGGCGSSREHAPSGGAARLQRRSAPSPRRRGSR